MSLIETFIYQNIMQNKNNLAWIDLEMTGLNPHHDHIIEAAMVITDIDLNVLEQSEILVIHQNDELLNSMDEWNTTTHTRTGLIERVRTSRLNEEQVEEKLLEFIQKWIPEKTTPMCGNSVHQDRRFLSKYMPKLEAYFHYRNLDVSTLKELSRRWNPTVYRGLKKKCAHQALEDILESIDELKYYRENFLQLPKNLLQEP